MALKRQSAHQAILFITDTVQIYFMPEELIRIRIYLNSYVESTKGARTGISQIAMLGIEGLSYHKLRKPTCSALLGR